MTTTGTGVNNATKGKTKKKIKSNRERFCHFHPVFGNAKRFQHRKKFLTPRQKYSPSTALQRRVPYPTWKIGKFFIYYPVTACTQRDSRHFVKLLPLPMLALPVFPIRLKLNTLQCHRIPTGRLQDRPGSNFPHCIQRPSQLRSGAPRLYGNSQRCFTDQSDSSVCYPDQDPTRCLPATTATAASPSPKIVVRNPRSAASLLIRHSRRRQKEKYDKTFSNDNSTSEDENIPETLTVRKFHAPIPGTPIPVIPKGHPYWNQDRPINGPQLRPWETSPGFAELICESFRETTELTNSNDDSEPTQPTDWWRCGDCHGIWHTTGRLG